MDAPMSDIDANFESEVSREFNILTLEEAFAAAKAGGGVSCVVSACHGPVDGALLDRLVPPGVDLRAEGSSKCNLKAVINYGVGVDHINLQDCRDRGLPVGHTPGVLTEPTADMGFSLLLAVARRVVEGDKFVRAESGKTWTKYDNNFFLGQDVSGTTIGVVGMGRIGLCVARRAKFGFGMKVLYHNRKPSEDAAEVDGEYVSLEDLLRRSDHVVLVCPLTEATTGLINKERLALMKPTATLINIARGPVVDTDDLVEALVNKQIFGAGLDVTEPGGWAPSVVSSSTVRGWPPSIASSSTVGEWAPSVASSSTVGEWAPSVASSSTVGGLAPSVASSSTVGG
jgi:lactate dehydrogenase-like 2-hydroxyacid dehydrogenase